MENIRLDKFLSNAGAGSRKEVRELIRMRAVKVDGVAATDGAAKIIAGINSVSVFESEIEYKKFIYLMMNKPAGVVTATRDPSQKNKTVCDLLPEKYSRRGLFPVGRLDKDAEGLLILTDDGDFAHKTLSPKFKVEKKYFVKVEGTLTQSDVASFGRLTLGDGFECAPALLEIISGGETSEAHVTITEGKFHQVKRMFEAAGKSVTYLKRIRFANIDLDRSLAGGECRELTKEEMKNAGA